MGVGVGALGGESLGAWSTVQGPPQVKQKGQQVLQLAVDYKRPRQEWGSNVAGVGKVVE